MMPVSFTILQKENLWMTDLPWKDETGLSFNQTNDWLEPPLSQPFKGNVGETSDGVQRISMGFSELTLKYRSVLKCRHTTELNFRTEQRRHWHNWTELQNWLNCRHTATELGTSELNCRHTEPNELQYFTADYINTRQYNRSTDGCWVYDRITSDDDCGGLSVAVLFSALDCADSLRSQPVRLVMGYTSFYASHSLRDQKPWTV